MLGFLLAEAELVAGEVEGGGLAQGRCLDFDKTVGAVFISGEDVEACAVACVSGDPFDLIGERGFPGLLKSPFFVVEDELLSEVAEVAVSLLDLEVVGFSETGGIGGLGFLNFGWFGRSNLKFGVVKVLRCRNVFGF